MEKLVKQILRLSKSPKWTWPEDWLVKAISLCFAIFLWYFVSGEDRVDMTVQIPVEIINLPRDLVISNQFKNQLEVTVSGSKAIIRGIDQQHVTRTIDLSKATSGNMVIHNDLDSIPFPHGIQTLRIQPSSITLLLDRLIQKDLPIKPELTGTLPAHLTLASVTADPATLLVSGPETILGAVTSLATEPIEINSLSQSTVKQIPLAVNDDLAELTGAPIIATTITLKEKIVIKNLETIPLHIEGVAEGYYALPEMDSIAAEISLPFSVAKKTKDLTSLIQASIQVTGLRSGSYRLPVITTLQKSVALRSLTPKELEVEMWEKKNKKRFY